MRRATKRESPRSKINFGPHFSPSPSTNPIPHIKNRPHLSPSPITNPIPHIKITMASNGSGVQGQARNVGQQDSRPRWTLPITFVDPQDLHVAQLKKACDILEIQYDPQSGKPELISKIEMSEVPPLIDYWDLDLEQLKKLKATRGLKWDAKNRGKADLIKALVDLDVANGLHDG